MWSVSSKGEKNKGLKHEQTWEGCPLQRKLCKRRKITVESRKAETRRRNTWKRENELITYRMTYFGCVTIASKQISDRSSKVPYFVDDLVYNTLLLK